LKPQSWPSIAYIEFNYKWDDEQNITQSFSSYFTGTLISTNAILTSAHSIVTIGVSIVLDNSSVPYTVQINKYHDTVASMYTVYLGLQEINDTATAAISNVSQIILVRSIKYTHFFKKYNA
jgi:hypothetical protein